MDYKIIIITEAKYDLRNIFYYYSFKFQNDHYAMKIYKKLVDSIKSLSYMPERYRLYDEITHTDIALRVMIVDKYKVFYHVDKVKKVVTIYHIFSSKSNIERKL